MIAVNLTSNITYRFDNISSNNYKYDKLCCWSEQKRLLLNESIKNELEKLQEKCV